MSMNRYLIHVQGQSNETIGYYGVVRKPRVLWQANHAYQLNDVVCGTNTKGSLAPDSVAEYTNYRCTVAGTSGASLPSFNTTVGATTSDGTVTWMAENGIDKHAPDRIGPVRNESGFLTYLYEFFQRKDIYARYVNNAVGGTGWWDDWVGNNGSSAYVSGDAGYDPNGYINTSHTAIAAQIAQASSGHYDKKILFMQNGHQDSGKAVTGAEYEDALSNLVDHNISTGYYDEIYIGLSGVGTKQTAAIVARYDAYRIAITNVISAKSTTALPIRWGGDVALASAEEYSWNDPQDGVHFSTNMAKIAAAEWWNSLKSYI